LGERRILVVRHRAEDYAVGLLGCFDGPLGKRLALGAQRRKPDRDRGERQPQAESVIGGGQHIHGGRRDLGPDAVALHHHKPNRRR
jgi:hypothetical protein